MRGRKPKPTALKVLEGNPGKRRINRAEPQPNATIPEPPEHLDEGARAEWERISETLYELGVLTEIDGPALAAYCVAYSRWVDAEKKVADKGLVFKSPNGMPTYSPYWVIANKAFEQMTKLLVEFGMTPSSRSRVATAGKKKKGPIDSWAEHARKLRENMKRESAKQSAPKKKAPRRKPAKKKTKRKPKR